MKQGLLPLIPFGSTPINNNFSVFKDDDTITWFYCGMPVRAHSASDRNYSRLQIAESITCGCFTQAEIVRAINVSKKTVSQALARYRADGPSAFFHSAPRRVKGRALTPEKIAEAQRLLDEGMSRLDVSKALEIKKDTVVKAIKHGRLLETKRSAAAAPRGSVKSERAAVDTAAELGMGCTRSTERVMAAVGLLHGAETRFEASLDVPYGGVLCALPSLEANGLFSHLEKRLSLPKGYYTSLQIVLLLSFMALLRMKTVERLRREAPGELGKLLGLDRIPEVRCLREKLSLMSGDHEAVEKWADDLCRQWMEAEPEMAGTLYVDGHVRVYHGKLTKLPRKYVARQKLCLRGVTDYWVNAADGRPFFFVTKEVDQGFASVLLEDIAPRLVANVPGQPSEAELEADKTLPRLRIVFDRGGYKVGLFIQLWREYRIAIITYKKNPGPDWPVEEFSKRWIDLGDGQEIEVSLAERTLLLNDEGAPVLAKEIRKLTDTGHQIVMISTDPSSAALRDAVALDDRWTQENFFRYMRQDFGIDLLAERGTEAFPYPVQVVNPAWRKLNSERQSLTQRLVRRRAKFVALPMEPKHMETKAHVEWAKRKACLCQEIEDIEKDLETAKTKRKNTPKRLKLDELPEEERFERLAPTRKLLLDTIRMTAYRAETAMASLIRKRFKKPDEARSVLKSLYNSSADILPNKEKRALLARIHPLAEERLNKAVRELLVELNATETVYPGTDMRLVYELGERQAPVQ